MPMAALSWAAVSASASRRSVERASFCWVMAMKIALHVANRKYQVTVPSAMICGNFSWTIALIGSVVK